MPALFFSDLLLVIVAAFIGGFVARSIKLPPVIGYVISGVIFGIIGKSVFQNYDSLTTLSQIGISLLLFTLGFEVSLDALLKIERKVFAAGFLQVVITSLLIWPLLQILGLSFEVAVFIAILFAFSSTAVVVKLLEEKGLLTAFPGNNIFLLLLLQDLFIVPVIFFMPVLFEGGLTSTSIASFAVSAAKPLLIFAAIVVFGRLFLSRILSFLFKYPSHELTILAAIFTASLSIIALTSVGLPESIAAFLAGVLISEQGKNLAPLSELRPFRDILLVLFFVMTGMLLNFNFFVNNIFFIIFLSVGVLLIKFFVVYVILRVFSFSPSGSVFISSYMGNVGEFAAVLGQIAFLTHFISPSEYNLILSVFILGLIYIPFTVGFARHGVERLARLGLISKLLPKEASALQSLERQDTLSNHVVICGHGRVGRHVRSLLEMAQIPYITIDFNKKVINDLIQKGQNAIYGDPSDPEILKASLIENARILVIALPDTFSQKKIISAAQKFNPNMEIICRSHIDSDRYDLLNLGVKTIISPELEAGLKIGVETLALFKVEEPKINSFIARVRQEHLL